MLSNNSIFGTKLQFFFELCKFLMRILYIFLFFAIIVIFSLFKSFCQRFFHVTFVVRHSVLLFSTTQNTAIFIFVVDTFPALVVLGTEVQIDIEIEHQHLAVVLHNGCVVRRCKG